jgi:hypothetical protein
MLAARTRSVPLRGDPTVLAMFPALLGSRRAQAAGLAAATARAAQRCPPRRGDDAGIGLLALDDRVARDGLTAWHDPMLWHSAKQEVSPAAAPITASCWRQSNGFRQRHAEN